MQQDHSGGERGAARLQGGTGENIGRHQKHHSKAGAADPGRRDIAEGAGGLGASPGEGPGDAEGEIAGRALSAALKLRLGHNRQVQRRPQAGEGISGWR